VRVPGSLILLLALAGGPGRAARAQDDPGAPPALEALLEQAASDRWTTRWAAVEGLARLPVGEEVFHARAALLRDPRPRAREAIAMACLLDPGLGNATLLGIALRKDGDAGVRRAAARALAHFPDRRAVDALVEALAVEKDPRTRLHIVATLRTLTPAPCLLGGDEWRSWWKANEGDPRFRPADEAARTGTYEGVPLETRTVAIPPGERRKTTREPPHVLVLPPFGWTSGVYGPYLLPLRRFANLTWVRLPGVQQLTGASGFGDDVVVYPVDRLVAALEAFRRALSIERFVVLADGASGWIAMRYAQLHPDRCAGLVLVDVALDKEAYAACLQRGAASRDPGERFTARTLLHLDNTPLSEVTLDRLHAIGVERGFLDRADLEIASLYARARDPQGFATVPDLSWKRHVTLETPALWVYSASSAFSGHVDADRIQRHFPHGMVAPIAGAQGLPWIESNGKFHEILTTFLRRENLIDPE